MTSTYPALRAWGRRRRLAALATTAVGVLAVGVPTDLIDTPVFSREVPPTWWSWPALLASAALAGLLMATYVREPGSSGPPSDAVPDREERRGRLWGGAGGLLTFFAVGCPVCNKLVLLALGAGGAMRYFEPAQPVLSLLAVVLLAWALARRLRGQVACVVPARPPVGALRPSGSDREE